MTEQQILDKRLAEIERIIRLRIDRNDELTHAGMMAHIREEVRSAMRDARLEALRGN